jgi:hypothetical protein
VYVVALEPLGVAAPARSNSSIIASHITPPPPPPLTHTPARPPRATR